MWAGASVIIQEVRKAEARPVTRDARRLDDRASLSRVTEIRWGAYGWLLLEPSRVSSYKSPLDSNEHVLHVQL